MKGIVLAGGLGTRLYPLTKVTNKALLPAYNKPMIYWPIETLVSAGIKDIFLVCGGNSVGDFLEVLGNGEDFGLNQLNYAYQKEAGGIAQALALAEYWAKEEPIALILSDNFFTDNFKSQVENFNNNPNGAVIFATQVDNPSHYGCLEFESYETWSKLISIQEKPAVPPSNWIQTGLYFYDKNVWNIIKQCKPSKRGELEIADVNNHYLQKGELNVSYLNGWWGDMGESIEVYHKTCCKIADFVKNEGKLEKV